MFLLSKLGIFNHSRAKQFKIGITGNFPDQTVLVPQETHTLHWDMPETSHSKEISKDTK